jgi:hypothetical protein
VCIRWRRVRSDFVAHAEKRELHRERLIFFDSAYAFIC